MKSHLTLFLGAVFGVIYRVINPNVNFWILLAILGIVWVLGLTLYYRYRRTT